MRILILLVLCLQLATTYGQRTISGTVFDPDGEPIIGSAIFVKGTTLGTRTDIDGNYTLEVPDEASELHFTYDDYEDVDVVIGERKTIDICLDYRQIYLQPSSRKKPKPIAGKVVNHLGNPLSGVRILVSPGRVLVYPDENGFFSGVKNKDYHKMLILYQDHRQWLATPPRRKNKGLLIT